MSVVAADRRHHELNSDATAAIFRDSSLLCCIVSGRHMVCYGVRWCATRHWAGYGTGSAVYSRLDRGGWV